MFDFPLMLRVKLPIVDKIYPQRNKFAMSVENKATGDSKVNDSPTDAVKHLITNKVSVIHYFNL